MVDDGTNVVATRYVYDGWRCIEEWTTTWPSGGTANTNFQIAAQYVYGGYIDEVLSMRRDTNSDGVLDTEYFYHTDDMYNVVAVTNASGAVVERYEYGPYGAPTFFDGAGAPLADSAIDNPYLWNGRRYDPETGLYYYRLRYMDPELGRFTTLDPIGLWGDAGNMGNGYAYVGNRPWAALDPFGLVGRADIVPSEAGKPLPLPPLPPWAAGTLGAVGSVFEIGAGLAVATGGTMTVVGSVPATVGGGAMMLHGTDSLQANLWQIWYNQPTYNLTTQVAIHATDSERAGVLIDTAIGFGDIAAGGVSLLRHSGKFARTVSCTAGPSEQAFALGTKLPDGSIARARSVGAGAFDPLSELGKLTNKEGRAKNALGLTDREFKDAIHAIKQQAPDNPDMTFGIERGVNFGNVYDRRSGEHIGNLFDG